MDLDFSEPHVEQVEVEIPARLLRAPRVHEWEFVQDLRSADRHWSPPQLGERVASVHVVGVPVGTRGVIIALHPSTGCVEVIWDEAVAGGSELKGYCGAGRGSVCRWSSLVSLLHIHAPPKPVPKLKPEPVSTVSKVIVSETKHSNKQQIAQQRNQHRADALAAQSLGISVKEYLATVNLYADYWKSLQPSGTTVTVVEQPSLTASKNPKLSAQQQTGSPRKPRTKRNTKKKSGVSAKKQPPS